MKSKNQILLFSIILITISLSLMAYKVKYLNFPLFQEETTNIWNIEAKITFDAKKKSKCFNFYGPSLISRWPYNYK